MSDFNVLEAVAQIAEQITSLREEIHRHPELGNEENRTADLIVRVLTEAGVIVERPMGTSVVARVIGTAPVPPGGSARVIGLRADMDALPVIEDTGAAFASENHGKMHACGHDVHVAGALGAALVLAAHRDRFSGEARFLFQPDEEGAGGADRMIAAGAVEGVDAVFGAHVSPDVPLGSVGVRYGKFYAASDEFSVTVTGRSTHGAEPEKGIDPIRAAAQLITRFAELPGQVTQDRCVLTVGNITAGTAPNIIPETATMRGILRTLGPETRSSLKSAMRQTIAEVEVATGARIDLRIRESYAGVVNTDDATALAQRALTELFGQDRVEEIAEPTMTTEDVGAFIDETSGSFYHVGVGGDVPLHSPHFLPDASTVSVAAAAHVQVLLWALRGTVNS